MLVDLYVSEARLFQRGGQFGGVVDGHTGDFVRPFEVARALAAAFVADEKHAARFQYAADFREALRKIGPEIHRFKCGDAVKSRVRKGQLCHVGTQHFAAPLRNGFSVDHAGFLHADCGVVNADGAAMRVGLQQFAYELTTPFLSFIGLILAIRTTSFLATFTLYTI